MRNIAALQVKYLRTNIISATKVCNSFPVRFGVGRGRGTRATSCDCFARIFCSSGAQVSCRRHGAETRCLFFFLNSLRPASCYCLFSSFFSAHRLWICEFCAPAKTLPSHSNFTEDLNLNKRFETTKSLKRILFLLPY